MSDKQDGESSDAWKIYVGSLAKWKLAFELWQKAGMEAMINYNQAVTSGKLSQELPQQVSEMMKTSWMESGME